MISAALWPRRLAIRCIELYQCTLSPDHGLLRVFFPEGCCIYRETCSDYAKRVIGEQGVLKGSLLALKRILHCTPWQVPDEKRVAQVLNSGCER